MYSPSPLVRAVNEYASPTCFTRISRRRYRRGLCAGSPTYFAPTSELTLGAPDVVAKSAEGALLLASVRSPNGRGRPTLCYGYTARGRLRRSGLPRSRLRGSGHRRRSSSRTLRSSSSTSALILTRQRAKVSQVAPAARSSFHRARIAAISSKSDRSIFVFVIT